jgi:tetratricopeptide (TPR) repeat protein
MRLQQHASILESHDRALAALAGGRAAEAQAHVEAAIRLAPGSTQLRLTQARIHLQLHDAPRALAALEAIALYSPDDVAGPDVTVLRAQAMIECGRDADALWLLEPLIASCPRDAGLRRLAAGAAERSGAVDRQVEHLRRIIEDEPSDQVAARTLGRLLAATDPHKGIDLMVSSRPAQKLGAQWQATRWMVDAGRDADAEESYRAMLAAEGDDADLWLEAADHARHMGSHDVATARYRRSLGLAPRNTKAAAGLARLFMQAGQFGPAVWWWYKVTRIDARNVEAWASLAICGLSADRPGITDRAERRLEPLAGEGARMEALAEAWLDAVCGDVVRQAVAACDPVGITASPLTWILQRSSEVLEQQAQRRPGWADTHYHTAVCRAALGDDETARDNVQAALDINPNYRAAMTLAASLPKAA